MKYISNNFSLSMLSGGASDIKVIPIDSLQLAGAIAKESKSVVNNVDVASVFSSVLKTDIIYSKYDLIIEDGDEVLVGQYKGPSLSEGCTDLPDGAEIRWFLILTEYTN